MRITCRNSASVRAGRREDRCFDLNRRSHPSRRNRRQFQLWHTRFGLHESVRHRERFLIVHPVNPPHVVPVVELVPTPWTAPDVVPVARAFMERVGQVPVVVTREIEGFLLNRLQGALLNEAFALLEEGYASAADIDATVSYGLGLRWSFMGPFETIDLNAPGGLDDYARRLEPLYHSVADSRKDPRGWSASLVDKAIRSAAIFSQKMTCLHGGNGATACSCASSVTFGVAVPPTRDEWSTSQHSSMLKRSRSDSSCFSLRGLLARDALDNAEGGA